MTKEKKILKDFYNTYGWHKNKNGVYQDLATFVDTRSVLDEYRHKTHLRVNKYLTSHGDYFLDAGSGAAVHPEHMAYSTHYKWRVSVDLSEKALSEARARIKAGGFFVQADVTQLPFKENVFTAIVSAHVIYHVPENEQESAVRELMRTLCTGKTCVIIYAWPNVLMKRMYALFNGMGGFFKKGFKSLFFNSVEKGIDGMAAGADNEKTDSPPIYSYHHHYRWFRRQFANDWSITLRCWRSVDRRFTQLLIPNNRLGKCCMRLIYSFETLFPYVSGRLGRYPMIIFHKYKKG
jgi:ubiquinone/menaquinone biosynthesis C-methylase UbiE